MGHIRSEGLLKVAEKWMVSEVAVKCFVVFCNAFCSLSHINNRYSNVGYSITPKD